MLLLTSSVAALACGGFFCDTPPPDPYDPTVELPVAQSGEQIVFGVDDGTVTAHVLISYEGDADAFAWVLPVPGEPDVFLSSERLFQVPRRRPPRRPCALDELGDRLLLPRRPTTSTPTADTDADTDSDTDADADADSRCRRPSRWSRSRPSARTTRSCSQADDARRPRRLAPGQRVRRAGQLRRRGAALRRARDELPGAQAREGQRRRRHRADRPRWPGERPSIPLSLTAIAATADMPVTVYLVGPGRGVPLSWLHVELTRSAGTGSATGSISRSASARRPTRPAGTRS